MEDQTVIEGALGDIYDAAVDPAAWNRLPAVLTEVTGAKTGAVYFDTWRAVGEMVAHGLGDDALQPYVAHYHQLDPWTAHARTVTRPRAAFVGDELVPTAAFAETEYCRDFARHHGIHYLLGAHFSLAPGDFFAVALHRPQDGKPFDAEAQKLLDLLLPHLERAAQLRRRLQVAEARAATGFAALSALSFAAIVCAGDGVVRFANAAAEALERGGAGLTLGARDRPLAVAGAAQTRALRRLVADAASGGAGGALRIDDPRGEVLLALVSPLPPSLRERPGSPGLALVAMAPSRGAPGFGAAVLAALFGLTPAEARLALALMGRGSLEEIAAARGVSVATVRTQLRGVFAKTGAESQRDLVRMLGAIPQLR